ncbi:MAG: redoxin domain-containing protein [Bacteroidetes bacterium]|jgi:peroxiredoxin|nr:redoxin domain-containing protein [Bacteroidota bacterium]
MNHFIIKLLLPLLLCFSGNILTAQVVITASDTAYANEEISFYKYHNQITYDEQLLGKSTVSPQGELEISIELDQPAYIFTRIGIYFAYIFAEPGATYKVALPQKQKKTMEDKLNPYFEETYIQLTDMDMEEENLNFSIRMFNHTYNSYFNKYIIEEYGEKDMNQLEEDIEKIEKSFKDSENEYFNSFRYYKYGFLKNTALQQKSKSSFLEYFEDKPVLYENTAYMDFFNQLFSQYFQYLGRTNKGKDLYDNINTGKSYENLVKTLQKEHSIENEQLLEMVVLKNLHDEFYNDKFSRSSLLVILDSLISQTTITKHQSIGKNIKNKVTHLLAGNAPPDFELFNMDSSLVSLDDFKGNYVYLNFCTANSYACLSEYEMIKTLYERHNKHLVVVTISSDPTYTEMKEFVSKRGYRWNFLHFGNDSDVLKQYDVRAFPTYFLIGPDGKLVTSPAPSPREGFEGHLFKVMRSRGDI